MIRIHAHTGIAPPRLSSVSERNCPLPVCLKPAGGPTIVCRGFTLARAQVCCSSSRGNSRLMKELPEDLGAVGMPKSPSSGRFATPRSRRSSGVGRL